MRKVIPVKKKVVKQKSVQKTTKPIKKVKVEKKIDKTETTVETESTVSLPPEAILALCKMFGDRKDYVIKAREDIKPGDYDVNCAIQLAGKVVVGEDFDKAPTVRIPLLPTLALFIDLMGIDWKKAKVHLRTAMMQVTDETKGKEVLEKILPQLSELEEEVKTEIVAHMKKLRSNGQVKVSGYAEEIKPHKNFAKKMIK